MEYVCPHHALVAEIWVLWGDHLKRNLSKYKIYRFSSDGSSWSGSEVTSKCEPFFDQYWKELWHDYLDKIFFSFEIFIMVIFSLEVVLYWIDGFKRYWSSGTKIFDFFITVMCFIPIICKEQSCESSWKISMVFLATKMFQWFNPFRQKPLQ